MKLEQENTDNKMKKTLEETEDLKKEYQTNPNKIIILSKWFLNKRIKIFINR